MTVEQELKLVESAKDDIKSFNALYEEYFNKIFSYCFQRLGNREASEDIVSQVFLLSVEQIGKFDTSKGIRFGSWLYKVAHNKIIDFYRKNKKVVAMEVGEDSVKDEDNNPEDEASNDIIKINILEILRIIKPRYQQVITLKFFSEFSTGEIAEVMEMKPAQVSVLLHRALKDFKKKYKKKFGDSEIFSL